jgi:hypothetical protein
MDRSVGEYLRKRFITGTPLESDLPVWLALFAFDYSAAALQAAHAEGVAAGLNTALDAIETLRGLEPGKHPERFNALNAAWAAVAIKREARP